MNAIDTSTPFDELTELRSVMTTQQIADFTGLRRETISRARADSRFQRRTERALGDLYAVVVRLRSAGGDLGQIAAVLRRPQPALGERSMAELLKEGRAEEIFEHLDRPVLSEEEALENIQFDPEFLAQLSASSQDDDPVLLARLADEEGRRVAALLDSDPELASVLPTIETTIHELFGSAATIRRAVVTDYEDPDGRKHLYVRVRSALSFDQEIDRLTELFDRHEDLFGSVNDRLTIGNL